jgi:hypothetical protein
LQGGSRTTGNHKNARTFSRLAGTQLVHTLSRKAGRRLQCTIPDGGRGLTTRHDPALALASGQTALGIHAVRAGIAARQARQIARATEQGCLHQVDARQN